MGQGARQLLFALGVSALGLCLLPVAAQLRAQAADSRHILKQEGRQLEVVVSSEFNPAMRDTLLLWVDYIAAALNEVYGHWPNRRWQVSISPAAASASDPIPWAQVKRGAVTEVEFYTSAHASSAELQQAWTGYHELAHLLIPYRGWGDAWFSEGLASYYQNILQARIGVISEREMWQKLYDGFQRGLSETRFDGQPLHTISDDMRENGGFMRVYWSGAWYFLAADTRLRQQSGGRLSLDTALAKLNDCCAEQQLAVPDIVARLDELNSVLLFRALYDQVGASTSVPPFDTIFASMGIDIIDGEVQLQERGPGARLRRGIIGSAADIRTRAR